MTNLWVEGLYNSRDTGGMPLVGGGETRSGVLFRSAALDSLSATGLEQFVALPIGAVADFRTPVERAASPDRLPTTRAIQLINFPLLEGAIPQPGGAAQQPTDPEAISAGLSQLPSLGDLYVSMLSHSAETFARLARLVIQSEANAHPAVLVHCTAGKDRTGVAVSLLLGAVGVDRDAIVADYASSQDHLAGPWTDGMVARLTQMRIPLTDALLTLLTKTPPEAIEQALDWVGANHGNAAGYLRSGALSAEELESLRSLLRG